MKFLLRIILINVFTLLSITSFAESNSVQTAELKITRYGDLDANGNWWCTVVLDIRRTDASIWSLGTSSFVFNYNYAVMIDPDEVVEGIWDNNTNPQYADQTIMSYNSGSAESIEIRLNTVPSPGTPVPNIRSEIGAVNFTTINPYAFHHLQWNRQLTIVTDADGNDITSGMNFIDPPDDVVPVELTSFTAFILKNQVTLSWTTVNEIDNSGFKIERKKNDPESKWSEAGFVKGTGNSFNGGNYSFTDKDLVSGKYYYRLKQIDFNGNYQYYDLSDEVEIGTPVKFALSQNYPNPFNPKTIINYQISISGYVELRVFDILGNEVKTLVNGKQPPGYYSIEFDGRSLASGIYHYNLSVNSNGEAKMFSETRKMILLK